MAAGAVAGLMAVGYLGLVYLIGMFLHTGRELEHEIMSKYNGL